MNCEPTCCAGFACPRSARATNFFTASNVVCAAAYGLLLYVIQDCRSETSWTDISDYFWRAGARIADFFHLPLMPTITANAEMWSQNEHSRTIAEELTLLISVLCASLLVVALWRLIGNQRRVLPERWAYLCALFAAPVSYVSVLVATNAWLLPNGRYSRNTLVLLLLAELIGVAFFFPSIRKWRLSILLIAAFFHYRFWLSWMWWETYNVAITFFVLLSVSGPWALVLLRRPAATSEQTDRRGTWIWKSVVVAGSAAVLAVIWGPWPVPALSRAQGIPSSTIEIRRGPCRGRCPVYRLLIHGDGAVEYFGVDNTKMLGRHTSRIERKSYARFLEELDSIGFLAIEDRAFRSCFDTPSVSLSVSTDHRIKQVVSDAACVGPQFGAQERFVRVVRDI